MVSSSAERLLQSVGRNSDARMFRHRVCGHKSDRNRLPAVAHEAMEAAALLGRRTAEMHLALSCSATDPAFAPEPCSQDDLEMDARQIEAQIRSALEALKIDLRLWMNRPRTTPACLLSKRLELIERSRSIANLLRLGSASEFMATITWADPQDRRERRSTAGNWRFHPAGL